MSTANMQGKVCLITGASSGIGKTAALGLAQMGATVVMVSRDKTRGEEAQKEIKLKSGNESIDLLLADLSSQESIRQLAENFKQRYTRLDVLINNAGLLAFKRSEAADGIEMTLAVNHLAPFLLTHLLLDVIKSTPHARIVNVSSEAQAAGYIRLDDLQSKEHYKAMQVYSQSKLALTLATYAFARRLKDTGVTVNCLHPGFVATNIAQRDLVLPARLAAKLILPLVGISPEKGAETTLYLATSPQVEGVTGTYFEKSAPSRSAAISYDESLQEKLWEISEKLVHLNE